ncbi:MAG: citrate synthase 2 [Nitrospinaceae bacterium]|nr:MAG: citrate synthase 2 [Nitrospinaceae bacterium]
MSQKLEVLNTLDTGLDGIPVCTSDLSLTRLDDDGLPVLLYRGYSIYDLIKGSFEESIYLLLEGQLPNQKQLQSFCQELTNHAHLEEPIQRHIKTYPKGVHMMDFLMTTLSFARMFDADYGNAAWQMPKSDEKLANLILKAGMHLGAKIPAIIASGYRIQKGEAPIAPDSSLGYAANVLHLLGITPEEDLATALNIVLILYLDHTINCSTFTSLVVESSMTDPYGPLIAAGTSLKGVRHGGANDIAAGMFDEIGKPENAKEYIFNKLNKKEIVFGFGHRLGHYKHNVESRVRIAEKIGRPLAEKKGMSHFFEIYDIISRIMLQEKNRTPNADLPICLILKIIGIPKILNTPIFQASRHFGWVANNARQRKAKGPLYRPTQEYTGHGMTKKRVYIPLGKR